MLVPRTTRAPFAAGARLPGALRHGLLMLVVGPVVLASGCTSNPEPPPLADPPPSSPVSAESPTPSPTPPSAPVMPDAAHGTSPKAAKAFAAYFFEVVNYSALAGDTSTLRQLSTQRCESCSSIASKIDSIYQSGGHISAEEWTLHHARVVQATAHRAVLSLDAHLGHETFVNADGSKTEHDGGKQPMTMFIRFANTGPVVTRLDLVT